MDLKNLILRELSEGLTEQELAAVVGVPQRTLMNVLAGRNPKDVAIWERFARYFRMDADFIRTGESAYAQRAITLPRDADRSTNMSKGRTLHSQTGSVKAKKGANMRRQTIGLFVVLAVWCISGVSLSEAAAGYELGHADFIPGDRTLLGTVVEIRSHQAKIAMSEGQPRYVPVNVRKDKRLPELRIGDLVEITINDQNLLVDVHKAGESSQHIVVRGQVAEPMPTGHDQAVIRTPDGKEEIHLIRPVAKSKVASIPVGADAMFLIDELDKIVDVTLETVQSVHRAAELGQQKSPLKGNLGQVGGVILKPLKDNTIVIRTEDGKEHSYQVRGHIQPRLRTLSAGDAAVLLVDEKNLVMDAGF
jgi:transcriptional regulator with XRE-family HTH domain/translation initiation factor IF-1